jgi:hypothetical protein
MIVEEPKAEYKDVYDEILSEIQALNETMNKSV